MPFRRLEAKGARWTGDNLELALGLPKTPAGMEMRLCPREECAPRRFQLGELGESVLSPDEKRIRRSPHTGGTTCPYCGFDSQDDDDFVDPEDVDALTEWFEWAALEDVTDAFDEIIGNFGRGLPNGGPLALEVTIQRRDEPEPRIWREDLLRHLTCHACARRYGVYAIGLFCPDCGAPNLNVHFKRECELVDQQIGLARETRNAELSFRLLGNAHEDVVTALETYLKTVYRYAVWASLPRDEARRWTSPRTVGNAFQNVERTKEKFARLGFDPFSALGAQDLAFVRLNIEKRHVLGHNLGLIDERYAEVASPEPPGRTVVLLADEVSRFAELAARVVGVLDSEALTIPPTGP